MCNVSFYGKDWNKLGVIDQLRCVFDTKELAIKAMKETEFGEVIEIIQNEEKYLGFTITLKREVKYYDDKKPEDSLNYKYIIEKYLIKETALYFE